MVGLNFVVSRLRGRFVSVPNIPRMEMQRGKEGALGRDVIAGNRRDLVIPPFVFAFYED